MVYCGNVSLFRVTGKGSLLLECLIYASTGLDIFFYIFFIAPWLCGEAAEININEDTRYENL